MRVETQTDGWLTQWQTPIGGIEARLGERGWEAVTFAAPAPGRSSRPAGGGVKLMALRGSDRTATPPAAVQRHLKTMEEFLSDLLSGRAPRRRPTIGRAGRTPFEERVWSAAKEIPFGQTVTYGDLAERAGRSGAARAVGQVMARNPLVLLIPCHRVLGVGAKGRRRLGGFTGGLELKRQLLALEGNGSIE